MEGREVANPSVLGQREHLDRLLPVEAAVAVPEIVGERELPVDDGRHEPPAAAVPERPGRHVGRRVSTGSTRLERRWISFRQTFVAIR
ncbi:MAG: hypothetical protein ABW228_01315 [Thermoleophilaceae bacterium]